MGIRRQRIANEKFHYWKSLLKQYVDIRIGYLLNACHRRRRAILFIASTCLYIDRDRDAWVRLGQTTQWCVCAFAKQPIWIPLNWWTQATHCRAYYSIIMNDRKMDVLTSALIVDRMNR